MELVLEYDNKERQNHNTHHYLVNKISPRYKWIISITMYKLKVLYEYT
jgi:hypothetical protein